MRNYKQYVNIQLLTLKKTRLCYKNQSVNIFEKNISCLFSESYKHKFCEKIIWLLKILFYLLFSQHISCVHHTSVRSHKMKLSEVVFYERNKQANSVKKL